MDIRRINTDKNFLEWDEWLYDYWENFDDPQDVSMCEIMLAKEYLDLMDIDINRKEIITFRATPAHFAYMIINFMRILDLRNPEIFSGNFCQSIDRKI